MPPIPAVGRTVNQVPGVPPRSAIEPLLSSPLLAPAPLPFPRSHELTNTRSLSASHLSASSEALGRRRPSSWCSSSPSSCRLSKACQTPARCPPPVPGSSPFYPPAALLCPQIPHEAHACARSLCSNCITLAITTFPLTFSGRTATSDRNARAASVAVSSGTHARRRFLHLPRQPSGPVQLRHPSTQHQPARLHLHLRGLDTHPTQLRPQPT
ncbi:hypothetical protein V8E36_009833 [Tilletia maclaganii]